jgi:tetratricopeptide (TPR) repeat protein
MSAAGSARMMWSPSTVSTASAHGSVHRSPTERASVMGRTIGHYQIVAKLGEGGMGEVYLGTDPRLDRKVAIKVLPPGTTADEDAERRMLREARIVATIEHPHVCTIYEIGSEGDRPYIVMQYVEGETLLERMNRGRIALSDTVDIASQITAALSEAHKRSIVHRDIKPGNIMIGPSGVVKVLDFGLAKSFDALENATQTAVSAVGFVAGTTPYMSPEQLRAESIDGRSDIFSLGVVLYEIASGRRPFDRQTAVATITAILTEEPAPIDSPLQSIIERALAKAPSRRFPSAAAMQEALRGVATQTESPRQAGAAGRRLVVAPAVDAETEKLYLRGRVHWNKRHPEAVRQAIACFQEAIERDPLYANAYTGLADAYMLLGFLQVLPPGEVMPKAKAAARRAIEIDRTLVEPHASLGYIAGFFDWDWENAKRELLEAMRLNPLYAWAPHWYGLLATPHSLAEAMEHVTRARDLDPLSPIMNTVVGLPLHQHRKYHDAIRVYSNVIQTDPNFAPAYYYIGMSYEQLGDYQAAVANLNRAAEISGRGTLFVGAMGHCLGLSGDHDGANQMLDELTERSRDRHVSPLNVMLIHLGLGAHDEALTWLDRALDERNGLMWMTPVEPRFDPLRGDSRFREMVGRRGLKSEP